MYIKKLIQKSHVSTNDKRTMFFQMMYRLSKVGKMTYSMLQFAKAFNREVNALKMLPKVLSYRQRLVLSNDEYSKVED